MIVNKPLTKYFTYLFFFNLKNEQFLNIHMLIKGLISLVKKQTVMDWGRKSSTANSYTIVVGTL